MNLEEKIDYYERLGVSREASYDDIKKAFRAMALKAHPDMNPGCEKEAASVFVKLYEAYDCLSDTSRRRHYDIYGEDIAQDSYAFRQHFKRTGNPFFDYWMGITESWMKMFFRYRL